MKNKFTAVVSILFCLGSRFVFGSGMIINAGKFGIDPSGKNDSSPGFIAALKATKAGEILYVPPGTYELNESVTWGENGITFLMSGVTFTGTYGGQGSPEAPTVPNAIQILGQGMEPYDNWQPAAMTIDLPPPANRAPGQATPDDPLAINIFNRSANRAGIAISSKGYGDAIYIGLGSDGTQYGNGGYGVDVQANPVPNPSFTPTGPMFIAQNRGAPPSYGTGLPIISYEALDNGSSDTFVEILNPPTNSTKAGIVIHQQTGSWKGTGLWMNTSENGGSFTNGYYIFLHDANLGTQFTVDSSGNLYTRGSIQSSKYAGSGNAYACFDQDGNLFRSTTPCTQVH